MLYWFQDDEISGARRRLIEKATKRTTDISINVQDRGFSSARSSILEDQIVIECNFSTRPLDLSIVEKYVVGQEHEKSLDEGESLCYLTITTYPPLSAVLSFIIRPCEAGTYNNSALRHEFVVTFVNSLSIIDVLTDRCV